MNIEYIKFTSTDGLVLDGLAVGKSTSSTVFIFIHGFSSSLFAGIPLAKTMSDQGSQVILFNNRGHDFIAKLKKVDKSAKKGYKTQLIGSSHEIFTDCVFDIEGAMKFVYDRGVSNIFLVGHSTGCQKVVYATTRLPQYASIVKGIILLAPVSDHAGELAHEGAQKVKNALEYAKNMVQKGRSHDIMPAEVWHKLVDAQRFLSLNDPESLEEIFSYSQPKKEAATLGSLKVPVLAILGDDDEHLDRPASMIADWLRKELGSLATVRIISGGNHNFTNLESALASSIHEWVNAVQQK